jgi:hypothetical protein
MQPVDPRIQQDNAAACTFCTSLVYTAWSLDNWYNKGCAHQGVRAAYRISLYGDSKEHNVIKPSSYPGNATHEIQHSEDACT